MIRLPPSPSVFATRAAADVRARELITAELARRYRPRRQRTAPLQKWLLSRAVWVHRHPTDAEIAEATADGGAELQRVPYRKEPAS